MYQRYFHHMFYSSKGKMIWIRLLAATANAMVLTALSLYLSNFGISDSKVGFLLSILSGFVIIFSLCSIPILEKGNRKFILLASTLLVAFFHLFMGLYPSLVLSLILLVGINAFSLLREFSFDLLYRDKSTNKNLNKKEGLLTSLSNLGWLIGPLFAGYFLAKSYFSLLFIIVFVIYLITTIPLRNLIIKEKPKERKTLDTQPLKNLLSFFTYKELRLSYFMSLGVGAWWAFVYIFVPLFILKSGKSTLVVSIFVSSIVIPLILFERYFGELSGKIGFRKMFFIAYAGVFVTAILTAFIPSLYIQLVLLFFASIFLAILEPNIFTFFFKQVKKSEEEKFYPTFMTSVGLGNFTGKFMTALILLYLPTHYSYLGMALLAFILMIFSLRIPKQAK